MKKTLTVNLGGTVFHIDEDAYRLLDNYLCNLKLHFRRQAGADEIVNDIELRISELFLEKLTAGSQVITITDVEEVINRMGKPEEMETGTEENTASGSGNTKGAFGEGYGSGSWNGDNNSSYTSTRRRLYRNPDDKMLASKRLRLPIIIENCPSMCSRSFSCPVASGIAAACSGCWGSSPSTV